MQNTTPIALAAIGLVITLYLSVSHIFNKKVVCPLDGKNCNTVLDSKYSRTFGIKNEFIGFLYYIAIISVLFMTPSRGMILATKIFSTLATISSLILIVIQIKVIKSYCFWCICTAIINVLLFILIIRM